MPLTRDEKQEAIAEIESALSEASTVYLTDYKGLTVDQANTLRRSFREADVRFRVLKNTLLRRAMESRGGFDDLLDQLNGPTAVAFTNDPASPAKVLKKFLDDTDGEVPRFKGAFVEGAIYSEDQLDALASLKSKDELIADILGLLMAPINNVASALNAQGAGLASVIQQISEKEEA
jgi:large subunit ribosomal protein L10